VKPLVRKLLHPFRGVVTWACQRGVLSSSVSRVLPWRWALEPFTIYGTGWRCRWFPTEFDSVGHRLFWSGLTRWEKETAPVILDHLRRARCFLDIGANCGFYTVAGCTVNPALQAVAVEPVPKVFAACANNVAQNQLSSRVTLLNIAVGDFNGTASFHESEDSTMGSILADAPRLSGKIIPVECRTLDSIVDQLNLRPDFMKIDVEGFEDHVLSGAGKILSHVRPRIVLEVNPGGPADSITEILQRHAYKPYIITDRGPELREPIVPDKTYTNWLCVPE